MAITPAITKLPAEILCQIFQSSADFSVVIALARTSRALYSIYLINAPSIFRAVAIRALPSLADAERLVDVQEEADTLSHPDRPPPLPSRQSRLFNNAHRTSAACKHWDEICQIHQFERARGDDSALRASERARFKRSFYHLWTLCTLANEPALQPRAIDFLDARDPVELAGLDEIATWANGFNENDFGDSGLDFLDGTWNKGFQMVGNYCDRGGSKKSGHRRIHVYGDEAPLGFWVFFDHTQHYLGQISAHW